MLPSGQQSPFKIRAKDKHSSTSVDRKHLEEPFLQEQIISFVFVHYCLIVFPH